MRPIVWLSLLGSLWATEAFAHDTSSYQAVVIGSGYGGSIAALRLGEKGVKTLVLERGRDWKVTDPKKDATFPTMEIVASGAPGADKTAWLYDRCVGNLYLFQAGARCPKTTGLLEYIDSDPASHHDLSPKLKLNGVAALVPAAVGGGSVLNNTVTYRPTEAGWNSAYKNNQVMQKVYKDLDKTYFALALKNLAPSAPPADILADSHYRGTQLSAQYAIAAGYPTEDPKKPATLTYGWTYATVLMDWNKVREELTGKRVLSVAKGEAWWGNNSGARRSLDTQGSYLARALGTGRVTLKSLHTVSRVAYDKRSKLYMVDVSRTDEAYNVLETFTITTPHLIMAAGSLGTTKLLVRARERGDLPSLNASVGTHFSTNGNMAHVRANPTEPGPVGQGGPAGIKITDFRDPKTPVVLENLPQRLPPGASAVEQTLILNAGLGTPSVTADFHYDRASDTVTLDWPADGAKNIYDRVTALYQAIPGGVLNVLPMKDSMATTLHPLGGVPLGEATNRFCKLKGYKHLYAVDGSLLPNGGAVTNPSLLISALAERCMSRIVESIADGKDDWEDTSHDDDRD